MTNYAIGDRLQVRLHVPAVGRARRYRKTTVVWRTGTVVGIGKAKVAVALDDGARVSVTHDRTAPPENS